MMLLVIQSLSLLDLQSNAQGNAKILSVFIGLESVLVMTLRNCRDGSDLS